MGRTLTMTTLGRLVFAGFPLLRRAPLRVLVWGACLLPLSVLSTLLSGVYDGLKGPWSYFGPERAGGWLQFGVLFSNMLVMCLGMAILAAAVFRTVADPDRSEDRWMRIGADELRLGLVWCMMFVTVFTGVFLIAIIIAATSRDTGLATETGTLVAALVLAATLLARFSLAPAMTVFERRVAVTESWRMMRGRYGVAIACALLFLLAYGGAEWLLSALGDLFRRGGVDAKIGYGPFVVELARYAFKPENLVPDLARVVVGTVSGVVAYAPLAVAYRDLTGRNPADQAAVFD
jgi:hypothetical protein